MAAGGITEEGVGTEAAVEDTGGTGEPTTFTTREDTAVVA